MSSTPDPKNFPHEHDWRFRKRVVKEVAPGVAKVFEFWQCWLEGCRIDKMTIDGEDV